MFWKQEGQVLDQNGSNRGDGLRAGIEACDDGYTVIKTNENFQGKIEKHLIV